ncbi:HD domain-containing protein, partial [Acidipropionibacterium jensenii]
MAEESVYGPYGTGHGAPGRVRPQPAEGTPQPRMRMRERIVRWRAPKAPAQAVLDPLISTVLASHAGSDIALLERAYETADHYHRGQTRKSGDPYITHPLAVAMILAELGMDDQTLCAGLLHDTVEDTSYTMEQLTADFGEEVALLVDGVTKLDKVQYGSSAKAETIRKMVIAMSRDIRVLVI